jgi:hypothetical protein
VGSLRKNERKSPLQTYWAVRAAYCLGKASSVTCVAAGVGMLPGSASRLRRLRAAVWQSPGYSTPSPPTGRQVVDLGGMIWSIGLIAVPMRPLPRS